MSIRRIAVLLILACFAAAVGTAQEEKVDQSFRAFSVAMGVGAAGVLDIQITRWTTPEERQTLVNTLAQDGQEKTVDLLRQQDETGWVRTQSGADMRGQPSVRLRYAYEFPQADGKRLVVLVTDRTLGFAEVMADSRSTEYDLSAIVLELQQGADGKEKGEGTLYVGAKLGFDADKKKLEVESYGQQPVRLTEVTRTK